MRKDLNTRNKEKYAHAFKDNFESVIIIDFKCYHDCISLEFEGVLNPETDLVQPSILTVNSKALGLLGVIRLERYYREDFINLENSLKEHSICMNNINGSDIDEQDINMYKPINLYMAQAIAMYNSRDYVDNIGDIYINYEYNNSSCYRLITCDTNDTTSCLETFVLCMERLAAILRSIEYYYKAKVNNNEDFGSILCKLDSLDFSDFLANYTNMINEITDNAEVTSVSPYDKITMKIIETSDEEETSCGCNCCNCNDCDCNDCDEMYSGDDCDYCDGCDGCDCECFDHCDGCVRDNSEDEDDYDDYEFEYEDEFEDDFDEEELDEDDFDEEDKEENVFERVFIAENPNIHFEEQTNKPDTKNKKKSTDKFKKSSCKQNDTEKNIGIQVGSAKVEAHITDGAIAIKVTGDIPSSIDDIDKFIRNLIEKI